MSTVFHDDASLVGLRNAIVRCLGVHVDLAQSVLTSLGEANREAYLKAYVLRDEPLERHEEIPSGPINWSTQPGPCWLDIPEHYPRETHHLDGTVTITYTFSLAAWIKNLLYNTDHLAKEEAMTWAREWARMPQAHLRGSAKVVPLPKRPRLLRTKAPAEWHGVPERRTHMVSTHDQGQVKLVLPGEIMDAYAIGNAIRYKLPGGWFIDDDGRISKRYRVPRFSLHLSGAHPSGCAESYERSNKLTEVLEAWRRHTTAAIPA